MAPDIKVLSVQRQTFEGNEPRFRACSEEGVVQYNKLTLLLWDVN